MPLRKFREYNNSAPYYQYREFANITTLNSTEDELWAILKRLTNRAQTFNFFKKKFSTTQELRGFFSEFIKQAELFHKQAELSEPKISPLLYYYSMLNLTKAYLFTKKPSYLFDRSDKITKKKLQHGIGLGDRIKKNYDFYLEKINILDEGIFPSFFKAKTGKNIKGIVRCKLKQNPYVMHKLMQTGKRKIIEDSPKDNFWGWGKKRNGRNELGKIWMKLRNEIIK